MGMQDSKILDEDFIDSKKAKRPFGN